MRCSLLEKQTSRSAREIFPLEGAHLSTINLWWGERPHDSELSRDDLRPTPNKIDRETCLRGRFLERASDTNLSEGEKAVSLHDAPRHLACPDFQAIAAKLDQPPEPGN